MTDGISVKEVVSVERAAAEKEVRAQIDGERKALNAKLREAERMENGAFKKWSRLDDAWWKLASRDLDKDPDAKELEAGKKRDAAYKQLTSIGAAAASNKTKLRRLDDPAEFDKRVAERIHLLDLRQRKGGNMTTGTKTRVKGGGEIPQTLKTRIVKMVTDKGMGISAVANKLNEEKVKTPSGGIWYARRIFDVVLAETGKTVSELRAKNPLASKAVADKAPAKTRALSKTNGQKAQAKPLTKAAQAAGTSRGGTGSKKKTAARKRGAAKKTTAARKRGGTSRRKR